MVVHGNYFVTTYIEIDYIERERIKEKKKKKKIK